MWWFLRILKNDVYKLSYVLIFQIDKVKFSFKIYQSTMVKKTKPASVTVYDYYEARKWSVMCVFSLVSILSVIILTSFCPRVFVDLSATVMYKITEDMCGVGSTG